MKTLIVAASHFLAVLLGGATVAVALAGCTTDVAPASEFSAQVPASAPIPPALLPAQPVFPVVPVDSCASFRGAWALQAPKCPVGLHAVDGSCDVFGPGAILLAQGFQGPDAWGCQATNNSSESFSICVHVDCR